MNADRSLSCLPMLSDVIDPKTLEVEVAWIDEDENKAIRIETFALTQSSEARLEEALWANRRKVHCEARARHSVILATTEKRISTSVSGKKVEKFLIINKKSTFPPTIEEGDESGLTIQLQLPDVFNRRCYFIDVDFEEDSLYSCPMSHRLRLADVECGENKIRICDDRDKVEVRLIAPDDRIINPDSVVTVKFSLKSLNVEQNVRVIASKVSSACSVGPNLTGFKAKEDVFVDQPGVYRLYRSFQRGIEIQAHFRSCSLGDICTCAVAVRADDVSTVFDVCTKGHLRVWAWSAKNHGLKAAEKKSSKSMKVMRIDDGREYKIHLSGGTWIILDSHLTGVKIFAGASDERENASIDGLCVKNSITAFKVPSKKSIFSGYFDPTLVTNSTLRDAFDPDCDLCEATQRQDFLLTALELGQNGDFAASTNLDRFSSVNSLEDEGDKFAQIFLSGERGDNLIGFKQPEEGWTMTSADSFCGEIIRDSDVARKCSEVAEVDAASAVAWCRSALLFSGDLNIGQLGLDKLRRECKTSLFRDSRFWSRENGRPPKHVADVLCPANCSGNGICDRGTCLCRKGFVGSDCSIAPATDVVRGGRGLDGNGGPRAAPRVSALADFGLCDVRTRPCRDLIVIGDGFVEHEALNCEFQLYKIRGVASKQLVRDSVLRVPAEFLSFQQVICPLPQLDIHDPDQVSNFNLGDNTDHTRVFAKVTLGYSGNGDEDEDLDDEDDEEPRSEALDLLLYDSLCWDCASLSGECKVRTKDAKCFFAAGTSSIQVFRIGRTISTRVSEDDRHTCSLPKDSGGCDNKIFRYYYNAIEVRTFSAEDTS